MKQNKTGFISQIKKTVLLVFFLLIVMVNLTAQSKDLNLTNEELAWLEEVRDFLSKRKPKPALAILDELDAFILAPAMKDSLDECRNLLGKYKMKDALAIFKNMELE